MQTRIMDKQSTCIIDGEIHYLLIVKSVVCRPVIGLCVYNGTDNNTTFNLSLTILLSLKTLCIEHGSNIVGAKGTCANNDEEITC